MKIRKIGVRLASMFRNVIREIDNLCAFVYFVGKRRPLYFRENPQSNCFNLNIKSNQMCGRAFVRVCVCEEQSTQRSIQICSNLLINGQQALAWGLWGHIRTQVIWNIRPHCSIRSLICMKLGSKFTNDDNRQPNQTKQKNRKPIQISCRAGAWSFCIRTIFIISISYSNHGHLSWTNFSWRAK